MGTKSQILDRMKLYRIDDGGIGSWLTEHTCDAVFERLATVDSNPLPAVQLNQLLVLAHEAPVSDGFYRYYWLTVPERHLYRVRELPHFQSVWQTSTAIQSLDHLAWGLHRLYVDGLLYFGNIRQAFRTLRNLTYEELEDFFSAKRIDTQAIKRRGPALPLRPIAKDQRYLISEMACKSYGANPQKTSDLLGALIGEFDASASSRGAATVTVRALLQRYVPPEGSATRPELLFSASEILDEQVASKEEIARHYQRIAERFEAARQDALSNTRYYLSMLGDLDVYVATSMRSPENFVKMAQTCDAIFGDSRLNGLNLRYFDPTLSAADGHEDKGLIECLMVKCAKALVYCAGEKESFGKDAEAAMALSLGRPVIFYCEQGGRFYREVHPLTRLIHFETGVAVGAMVAEKLEDVAELLSRLFENRMVYELYRSRSGALRLVEQITGCVVRLQTADKLIMETFWNHYHQERDRRPRPGGAINQGRKESADIGKTVAAPSRKQGSLPLEDTTNVIRLAARSAAAEVKCADVPSDTERAPRAHAVKEFPLSTGEVFDAISRAKRSQATGVKRYAVFEKWLDGERLDILEGVKLLRFIELTLDAHKARPSEVYTAADLSRWYREMSEGEPNGSWG